MLSWKGDEIYRWYMYNVYSLHLFIYISLWFEKTLLACDKDPKNEERERISGEGDKINLIDVGSEIKYTAEWDLNPLHLIRKDNLPSSHPFKGRLYRIWKVNKKSWSNYFRGNKTTAKLMMDQIMDVVEELKRQFKALSDPMHHIGCSSAYLHSLATCRCQPFVMQFYMLSKNLLKRDPKHLIPSFINVRLRFYNLVF